MSEEIKNDRQTKIIDVQVDEARKLAELQQLMNSKFMGCPKDMKIWAQLSSELVTRAAELGFVIEVNLEVDGDNNWIPVCDVVGRTDTHLENILQTEGPDIERKAFDAKKISSAELKKEGVDTDLLG